MSITVETNEEIQNFESYKEATPEKEGKGQDKSASEKDETIEKSEAQEKEDDSEIELEDESEDDADAESEDDSDDENDDESEDDSEKEEKPKRKSGFKKRVDKLNKRISARDQEIEILRRQLAEREIPTEEKPQNLEKTDSEAPDMDDFDDYTDYIQALTDYKVKVALNQDKDKNQFNEKISNFQKRTEDFASTHEDFKELISDLDGYEVNRDLQSALIESELAPELMYELAKNPDEFHRINALNALGINRALGRIEAKLEYSKSPEKKTVKKKTSAPKPLEKLGTKGKGEARSIFDLDLSQKEYERLRNEQLKKR